MSKYEIICKETDDFCINYKDVKCVRVFIFLSLCIYLFFFFQLVHLNVVICSMVTLLFALIIQPLAQICGRT